MAYHHRDDDWERDINFRINPANGNHHSSDIFRRKGVYTMEPDKELILAYERYKYPQPYYLEDDDTCSSITSGSVLSSRFSEMDAALNGLDDFMYDEPPPLSNRSSTLLWTPVTSNYDLGQFHGVVKKVSAACSRYQEEIEDNDDWIDDIDMPTKGVSSLKTTSKVYDQQLPSLDDIEDFYEEKEKTFQENINKVNSKGPEQHQQQNTLDHEIKPIPALPSYTRPPHLLGYEPERDDEDEDMTGLDFPDNMSLLPKRLDEKKKYNHKPSDSATTANIITPLKTKLTTKIPVSAAMKKVKARLLSSVQRENDDDDFCDGLHIKEKAFTVSPSTTVTKVPSLKSSRAKVPTLKSSPLLTRSNNQVQQQHSRNAKGKEPANFVSRLARPSPLLNNSSRQSDHAASLAKRPNVQQLTLNNRQKLAAPNPRQNFLSGTRASRQCESDNTASKSNDVQPNTTSRQYLTMNKSLIHRNDNNTSSSTFLKDNQPAEKKSANGYTLIARPKTKVTTYCTRLDNIDNLNDLRPRTFAKKSIYTQKSFHLKGENKTDPDRPWRKIMQATNITPDRSKVKLIQPNEQNLKKEYNNMTYDDSNHCWRGNENSLVGFQDKPAHRRPMLIMNKQQKNAPSRYAAVVGSTMIFNTELQKWVSANGQGEECNELDTIEDLKDEISSPSNNHTTSHSQLDTNQVDEKLKDFKLTVANKRRMMFEQEQHQSWMANWPIRSTDDINLF